MNDITTDFDLDCKACPQIATFLNQNKIDFPDYLARLVPQFGVKNPTLLIDALLGR